MYSAIYSILYGVLTTHDNFGRKPRLRKAPVAGGVRLGNGLHLCGWFPVGQSAYNFAGKKASLGRQLCAGEGIEVRHDKSEAVCTSLPDSFLPDCWARTSFAAGRSCRCSAPGRSRPRIGCPDGSDFACLPWRKTPRARRWCGKSCQPFEGVQSVKLNPATGSVLIVYREDEVRPELLFAAVVRLMNLDAELKRMPQPVVTRELREILGSVNRMVYDRTGGLIDLWSAGLILLAAIGIQRLLVQGMRAFPAGLTLVWWGLASLLGGRQS